MRGDGRGSLFFRGVYIKYAETRRTDTLFERRELAGEGRRVFSEKRMEMWVERHSFNGRGFQVFFWQRLLDVVTARKVLF